ncbi:MAG: signal peptidase II [Novosphingobium sp.]|nr:signal peptidase II [Novosphingobium sp.]
MTLARARMAGLGLAAAIFAVDQWVKALMISMKLRTQGPFEILPFFDLRWTENYGVSLGMLTANSAEMRWLLVLMTSVIALVVLVWMLREKALPDILALALVLGGALGNIRDRMTQGFVIDYADLHFGEFRPFLIFNIADAAITIGVVIILARSLFSREKPETTPETAPES